MDKLHIGSEMVLVYFILDINLVWWFQAIFASPPTPLTIQSTYMFGAPLVVEKFPTYWRGAAGDSRLLSCYRVCNLTN